MPKKKKDEYTVEMVDRYTDWVLKYGVTKAQEMQAQVMKNIKKFKRLLLH